MRTAILATAIALSACAARQNIPAEPPLIEADEQMVIGCRFLGTISREYSWVSQHDAVLKTMAEARKLGATHYKDGQVYRAGDFSFGAVFKAYRCEQPVTAAQAAQTPGSSQSPQSNL
jgi:hypothetical protein